MTERPRLPSLEQGLVVGVKEFAASHAISEENQRKSKALTEAVNARIEALNGVHNDSR